MNDDSISTDPLAALAPQVEPFDPGWSSATLDRIRSEPRARTSRRPRRRYALVAAGVGFLTLGTATAVAVGGPEGVIRDVLTAFGNSPDAAAFPLGDLQDPLEVARFRTENGLFVFWVATSSTGDVCSALADGTWDGEGNPTRDELDYGCGGELFVAPDRPPVELTRPDQLGGFFKDSDGPLVYGVAPYPDAVSVRVSGVGVDRLLPIRADSHGYGAAVPEAARADEVTLTFLDASGATLGTRRSIAPVG